MGLDTLGNKMDLFLYMSLDLEKNQKSKVISVHGLKLQQEITPPETRMVLGGNDGN